ncbi:hypothetical protein GCM10009868_21900 [Terrabacter aerolatus]|uniref:Acetone carboxylase n=1 Tax=Terrabacter aerolatus TaxID=422442 RepID=A0A512D642_9MICO|nr:hypothetical protein [Terrabacter aerolatus]GEO31932.1 hypothetical protein TAE01_37420 [Terrabacter aerolatus]
MSDPRPASPLGGPEVDHVCSAKGCRATAAHAVVWNNPKLHTADRRKVWLACDEHEKSLADFVALRGFLIEVVPVGQLTDADG